MKVNKRFLDSERQGGGWLQCPKTQVRQTLGASWTEWDRPKG